MDVVHAATAWGHGKGAIEERCSARRNLSDEYRAREVVGTNEFSTKVEVALGIGGHRLQPDDLR